jgi:CHAT domain-containing protein
MNTRSHLPFLFSRCLLKVLVVLTIFSLPALAQDIQPDIRQLVVGERIEQKPLDQELHIYVAEFKRGQVLRVNFQEKGADILAFIVQATDQRRDSVVANFGSGFMQESLTFIAKQDSVYGVVVRAQPVSYTDAKYEMMTSISDQATEKDILQIQAEQLLDEANQIYLTEDKRRMPLAITKLEEGLKIWRRIGETYWEAFTIALMGNISGKMEDFSRAETYLKDALRLFEASRNEPQIAAISISLGVLYGMTKNEEKAKFYIDQAVRISRSLGDKRIEEILNVISLMSSQQNNGQPFTRELAAARAKKDKLGEAIIWAKALFKYVTNDSIDDDQGQQFLERAEREALPLLDEINDRDIKMQILTWLGVGLSDMVSDKLENEEKLAIRERLHSYLRQVFLLAKASNNQFIQAIAYKGLNSIYDDEENDKLAIFLEKKMLNSIQELRLAMKGLGKENAQDLTKKFEDGYDVVATDLLSEGRLEEALQVLNYSRDQEFFDFKLIQKQQPATLALTQRESENNGMFDNAVDRIIAKYAARLDTDYRLAADELKAVFSQLEQNFIVPASEKDVARNLPDTADMQSALRELGSKTGKKYATIYVNFDSSNVLLITPESIKGFGNRNIIAEAQAYSVPLYEQITKQVRAGALSREEAKKQMDEVEVKAKLKYVELLSEQSEERIIDFLNALRSPDVDPRPLGAIIYRRIFKKTEKDNFNKTLEAELGQYKPDVLLWSLSGNMRYIPVAALYDEENKQYLVEKYQNAVFTRARKERFLIEPKAWTIGVGFGTSVGYKEFPPLPGVIKEISTIFGDTTTNQKGLFNGQVFLNRAFTRQALLAAPQTKPALIHIASHFSFQPGDARNSFLLLGDGSKLSIADMQHGLDLFEGVDLLTLSACETAAQQPNANGKEVDGFAELAQRLGASSVIATLWKVSDDGTSKLMSEFYRLRQESPNAAKSEILRQAQLNLLNGKSSAEEGAKRRSSRGPKIVGEKKKIPFKPSVESPFEHPYYWAPFVLFGSSR